VPPRFNTAEVGYPPLPPSPPRADTLSGVLFRWSWDVDVLFLCCFPPLSRWFPRSPTPFPFFFSLWSVPGDLFVCRHARRTTCRQGGPFPGRRCVWGWGQGSCWTFSLLSLQRFSFPHTGPAPLPPLRLPPHCEAVSFSFTFAVKIT